MIKNFLYSLLLITVFISCSPEEDLDFIIRQAEEELAEEETSEEESSEEETSEETTDPNEPDEPPATDEVGTLTISQEACDYGPDTFSAGETYKIACTLDLSGQTISLPSEVTLEYDGGQIINGTLSFNGGKIDGRLLNKDLLLTGNVSLLNEVFDFYPERWDITQGETTSEIAQKNNDNLEWLMFRVKELGATTFNIGEFDAYFQVSNVTSTTTNQNFYRYVEAVNIPGDFALIMSDDTILRAFPGSGNRASALLAISNVSNVTVKGGVLYGDRDLRQYTRDFSEEGVHLLNIRAGKNVVVDSVTLTMGAIGGVFIDSFNFSFQPNYNPSNNITVRNCTFDKIRTIAIPITDGYDLLIENNTFIDTAQPTANSDGGVVGYAIDIEPVRERNSAGELVEYQIVKDLVIRGNTERGSREGSFTIYSGNSITIEENNLESLLSWSFARNSKVRNNTFNAKVNGEGTAIVTGGSGDTVFNNEISGNTFNGYESAIVAYFGKVKIFGNEINDTKNAISLKSVTDVELDNNTITSSITGSSGITGFLTNMDNVSITNNTVDVKRIHLNFTVLNQEPGQENFSVLVEDNFFTSPSSISDFARANGVVYRNNESAGRMQVEDASNIKIESSKINSSNGHGISLKGVNTNISIVGNQITYPSNFDCINIPDSTNSSEVNTSNNTCN